MRARHPKIMSVTEVALADVPEAQKIIDPWLVNGDMAMIYAATGVGKTFIAMTIAFCASSQKPFLHWHIWERKRVLYIDGENGLALLKKRVNLLMDSLEVDTSPDYFGIVTSDHYDGALPPLDDKRIQQTEYDALIADYDLIVIDNLDTIAPPASSNEGREQQWTRIREWAFKHRANGKTFLFVHHENKSGTAHGTSKIANSMTVIVHLKRPYYDSRPGEYECLEWHFKKGRNLMESQKTPMFLYQPDDSELVNYQAKDLHTVQSQVIQSSGFKKASEVAQAFSVSSEVAAFMLRRAKEYYWRPEDIPTRRDLA